MSSLNSKMGPKQTNDHSYMNKSQYDLHKIPSLPIFRKNLINSSRLRERLQVDNHKFFGKLSASGPDTLKILKGIKGLQCIKFVQKFEFDPYMCDRSHLGHLRRICHKITDLQHLNLVIRRVDFSNEVGVLSPFISRFSRITSLRIEFPGTKNVHENSLIQLYKAIGKCSHLRFCECKTIGLPEKSFRLFKASNAYVHRLKWLESLKTYEMLKKGLMKNQGQGESKAQPGPQKNSLKVLNVTLSSAGEWANMELLDSEFQKMMMRAIAGLFLKLEKIRIQMIRTNITFEQILNFFTMIPLIPTLYHAEYEVLSCQISDVEIQAFARGLVETKQLKYFNLKVIQKPNISEECIEKFAAVLSKLNHLSKFDIYIRRLDFHPRAIQNLGNRIRNFENIQCCCSKKSIHLYRRNETKTE